MPNAFPLLLTYKIRCIHRSEHRQSSTCAALSLPSYVPVLLLRFIFAKILKQRKRQENEHHEDILAGGGGLASGAGRVADWDRQARRGHRGAPVRHQRGPGVQQRACPCLFRRDRQCRGHTNGWLDRRRHSATRW